jgi:hypothetical protein
MAGIRTAEPARPERIMVRRAMVAGLVGAPVATAVAYLAGGGGAAASALIAVAVVVVNFAAHGLSLAWAAGVSITAVHAVALGGVVGRLGVIVALMVLLDRTAFFSPLAFGLTAVIGTLALLVYEARLVQRGLGGELQIPPDPAAVQAHERLRLEEARR